MKRLIFSLTLIGLVIGLTSVARAEDDPSITGFLVQTGEYDLSRGNVQSAIHEFSKALMVDPDNQKAKAYLKQFNLSKGIYSGAQSRETQLISLANDVKNYKGKIKALQKDSRALQKRNMMLEDVIARKGDFKLLKDVEDYYRQSAYYEADETLPADKQLADLKTKQKAFEEFNFDKDRVQNKRVAVMSDLLSYQEEHLQDARDEVVDAKIQLAENRKELLFRMDQLKSLNEQYAESWKYSFDNADQIDSLKDDLAEANEQVDILLHNRQQLIQKLNQQVKRIKEAM